MEKQERVVYERTRAADRTLPALTYCLLENRVDDRSSFSICCRGAEAGALYEREALVRDVTSDGEAARRLVDLLCEGIVTPYALAETVTEWLG